MFTGIISHQGKVERIDGARLTISAPEDFTKKLKVGTSVAVQGACVTVVERRKHMFSADIMPETNTRTTFYSLRRGALVNLELPATPNTFLSGHFVQGHIDGIGHVKRIRKERNSKVLSIAIPLSLSRSIVKKGSVAVDGVSLTIIDIHRSQFSVGIVPHTWNTTTLKAIKRGDRVNIEVDILAKYVRNAVKTHTV